MNFDNSERLGDFEVGDYVHNVPHGTYGLIVEDLEPIHDIGPDGDDYVAERRLMVLYNNGNMRVTGSTFLKKIEVVNERR